ncbi:hypothetical protein [Rhizobium sp. CFBP 13726]|uniref:hypothetical protein n=1 Tax=Rhizobium sp. CFBP 13726 TaxID=2775296 RepID=UPI00406CB1C2
MAALKILEHVRKKKIGGLRFQRQHPIDNKVRPGFIRRIQIPGFGSGLERTHDHAGGIGSQEERLAVDNNGF